MRYFETILKIGFLIPSLYLLITRQAQSQSFMVVLTILSSISVILGFVLLFNKKSSYNYPQTKRDLLIRKIEGILLILTFGYVLFSLVPVFVLSLRLN